MCCNKDHKFRLERLLIFLEASSYTFVQITNDDGSTIFVHRSGFGSDWNIPIVFVVHHSGVIDTSYSSIPERVLISQLLPILKIARFMPIP